ncbi:hypothetical protein JOC49_000903 [Fusibacter tunisiensis]|uniref:Uncharacterized protein n=1 Tax=Fusibacter tunisiensis TaxID=1008308 RepID=A0ABS2MPQ8_9FIRM|nr:hypothetical protein [Fusibacter tunisiensis]
MTSQVWGYHPKVITKKWRNIYGVDAKKLDKLKRFNLIMGLFHLVQAIIMLFLSSSVIQKNS